jgi:GWxTD domain-containing protein
MALAERRAWEELRRGANARIAVGGDDAIAWMARGLAGLRLNELGAARVAFDSGLARMTPAERARFADTRRLVPPADSVRVSALAPATRAEADRRLWALADPLALTPENEHWLEFLGRVTFAELRWTSDDLYLRGADSDRGDVHVRYGPPDLVASFPAEGLETNRIIWFYELGRDDLTFIFEAPPTYGTARFAAEPDLVADAKNMRPAGWTNVPITRGMDTVAMQVARFRAAGDSSDVLITAALPIRRMSTGIDLARGTLGIGLSLLTSDVRTVLRDTTRQLVPLARDDSSHRRVWQLRLAPAAFTYRVEALQEESMRAARAVGPVTVEATRGFGMSDVLLAERVAPRDSARVDRWSDLLIVPSDLAFRSGQPFDIVWETYDLGAAAGQSRYRVDISLRVLQYVRAVNSDTSDVAGAIATATSSFLLRTIDRANVLVKRLTGAEDVALSFTRERRAGPVALDYLTMELGEARGGRYRLTVRTTDLQTNRTTSRERDFLVVER